MSAANRFSLPSRELCAAQAEWLRPARARLLRRAGIARRRRILDLAAGWKIVTAELVQRSAGIVIAFDQQLPNIEYSVEGAVGVIGTAEQLPFRDGQFDLVFVQCGFLWFDEAKTVIAEAVRVLEPGGVLAVIEPDFGGLMEFPPESSVRSVWLSALQRAGAEPKVGRSLPTWFQEAGLRVEASFLDRLEPPSDARFDLLKELPLTVDEQQTVDRARKFETRAGTPTSHLPFWLVLGEKRKEEKRKKKV